MDSPSGSPHVNLDPVGSQKANLHVRRSKRMEVCTSTNRLVRPDQQLLCLLGVSGVCLVSGIQMQEKPRSTGLSTCQIPPSPKIARIPSIAHSQKWSDIATFTLDFKELLHLYVARVSRSYPPIPAKEAQQPTESPAGLQQHIATSKETSGCWRLRNSEQSTAECAKTSSGRPLPEKCTTLLATEGLSRQAPAQPTNSFGQSRCRHWTPLARCQFPEFQLLRRHQACLTNSTNKWQRDQQQWAIEPNSNAHCCEGGAHQ